MASLGYVMARWLRSRRLIVVSVGAGRGCGGLRPRPLPRQGGGLGLGDFLLGGGHLGVRGGGRPWLHSRGDFAGVVDAPVGLVLRGDAWDGLGAVELQGVVPWLVWGAASFVELPLAVPGHPDLHPNVWARVLEAVLDCALALDPVTRVVVVEGLLDSRALLELWVCFGLGRCLWREGG